VKVPVAANCWVVPRATDAGEGNSAIETNAAGVTVRFVDPPTPFALAVSVAVPTPALTASPAVFTAKIVVSLELHTAELLRSCLLPSV
jgi:hypothetical protein